MQNHLQVQQVSSMLVQVAQRWRDVRHNLHTTHTGREVTGLGLAFCSLLRCCWARCCSVSRVDTHTCAHRQGRSSPSAVRVACTQLPAGPVTHVMLQPLVTAHRHTAGPDQPQDKHTHTHTCLTHTASSQKATCVTYMCDTAKQPTDPTHVKGVHHSNVS